VRYNIQTGGKIGHIQIKIKRQGHGKGKDKYKGKKDKDEDKDKGQTKVKAKAKTGQTYIVTTAPPPSTVSGFIAFTKNIL
jgi:hypothetical protein